MNLFPVYPLFDVTPVRALGTSMYDAEGKEYLDFYGGHAVISIGHTHPHYVQRVTNQLQSLGFYSNSVPNPLQQELADSLSKQSGYPDHQLFMCNSGTEAVENALKIASAHNGRKKILAFDRAFHGRTSLALSVTDNPNILFPVNEGAQVVRFALNDFEGTQEALSQEDISSVILEPILGVGGIESPSPAFMKHLRRLCDETGTALIMDEVQSGFGRSGQFFAHQHFGIEADLIPMAKGMGNGFPVGGVLIHPRYQAKHGMLGTTFGGNHLACAASLAVLEVLEQENLIEHAEVLGTQLRVSLAKLPKVKEVRGMGLMIGLELEEPVAEIRKKLLYEYHIFTGSSSNKKVLRLLPPLNINEEACEQLLHALQEILS